MILVRISPNLIPRSPAALLTVAAQLDAFWAAQERAGITRPTLEEELAAWSARGLAWLGEPSE